MQFRHFEKISRNFSVIDNRWTELELFSRFEVSVISETNDTSLVLCEELVLVSFGVKQQEMRKKGV